MAALLKQKFNPPAAPKASFKGKTIIVTGANAGLGYEATVKFVALGASKVIIASRTLGKGNAAKSSIESRTGKKGIIEVWKLEMGSYDSIKAFAQKASTELKSLDIALLNAGVMDKDFSQSEYGWETTIQVNTLSTTLLALLLLPKLKASKTTNYIPVLEIVSSGLYPKAEIASAAETKPLEFYSQPENWSGRAQYSRSKYFVQCAVKMIAKQVQPSEGSAPGVVITSVCPGACKSELGRAYSGIIFKIIMTIMYFLLFRTTEEGSRTLVSGTTQGVKSHGGFWKNDRLQPDAENLSGSEKALQMQKVVWNEILDALRRDVPRVLELVQTTT